MRWKAFSSALLPGAVQDWSMSFLAGFPGPDQSSAFLRSFWQEFGVAGQSGRPVCRFSAVIISRKIRHRPFPKPAGIGTYPSHPMAWPRAAFSGSLRTGSIGASGRWPISFRYWICEGAQRFIAGWSSPVARQAHNLKVIGSNPIPATTETDTPRSESCGSLALVSFQRLALLSSQELCPIRRVMSRRFRRDWDRAVA